MCNPFHFVPNAKNNNNYHRVAVVRPISRADGEHAAAVREADTDNVEACALFFFFIFILLSFVAARGREPNARHADH